jgi:O-antigen/teichoic acid export membrane protein
VRQDGDHDHSNRAIGRGGAEPREGDFLDLFRRSRGRAPVKRRLTSLVSTAQSTLPEGTGSVGAGLIVASVAAYVFVVVSLNALTGGAAAAFSAFWAVIFVAGPGFFLPLEQEVSRSVAHRRSQGLGSGPLIGRAARLGAIITVVLVVVSIASTPLLNDSLYHGDLLFVPALAIGIVGFYVVHLTRGVLAGSGRFRAYGVLLGADSLVRLAAAVVMAFVGVEQAGAYALALALSPFVAVAIALWGQRGLREPGPEAAYSELSASLGWLLVASVLTQALAYSSLIGVNVLAGPDEKDFVAGFASAFFVARVPVLAFQAVQGTLLPKLAGLTGSGRHDEFRRGLNRLLGVVVLIAVLGTVLAFLLGPFVGNLMFKDFSLDRGGLALLAAGSGAFIVALTLAQAMMAVRGYVAMTVAWGCGLFTCVLLMAVIPDLELRVELGFLVGAIVSAVLMAWSAVRKLDATADPGIDALVEAIEHEPMDI